VKKYAPISFDLIEEGRLAASLDEEIHRASRELLKHVQKYGPDATKKSKAEVTLKITLSPENAADGSYSIVGAINSKIPGRPAHATLAIHEQEQTGEETLFVRASGSDSTTPRQMKLATDDGKAIDPNTGEVLEPPSKKDAKKKEAN
jgi:hypothetical protein